MFIHYHTFESNLLKNKGGIFCSACCFTSTVNNIVNCLTILLLGKPSRGSLPVVSAYFSVSNLQLALLKSEEEGKKLRKKMQKASQEFISGPLGYKSDTLPIQLLSTVGWLRMELY